MLSVEVLYLDGFSIWPKAPCGSWKGVRDSFLRPLKMSAALFPPLSSRSSCSLMVEVLDFEPQGAESASGRPDRDGISLGEGDAKGDFLRRLEFGANQPRFWDALCRWSS